MRRALFLCAAVARSLAPATRQYDTHVRVSSRLTRRIPTSAPREPSLTEYMRLPTAQYALLDLPMGANLERAPPPPGAAADVEHFLLVVPPVRFFFLTVEPNVKCTVETTDDSVVVAGRECVLEGSDGIIRSINRAFVFEVIAKMTWVDSADHRRIDCAVDLRVDVAPPGPFRAMPRRVLETTGNAVMRVATDQILNGFLQTLVRD